VEGELLVKPDEDQMMMKAIKQWFMQYTMKTKLIEALREDVKAALAMVEINQQTINVQQSVIVLMSEEVMKLREEQAAGEWWKAQDEDQARQEAEERADEINKLIRRDETLDALRINKEHPVEVPIGSPEYDDNGEYIPVHLREQAE